MPKQTFANCSLEEYLSDEFKGIRKKYPYLFTCLSCSRMVLSKTDDREDGEEVCKECMYVWDKQTCCDIKEFLEYLAPKGKKTYYKNLLKDDEFVIVCSVVPTKKECIKYLGSECEWRNYDCLFKWKIEGEEEYKFEVYNGSSRFAMWMCGYNFEW